jgi:hypothetical protein
MLKFAVMGRKPGQNAESIVSKGVNLLGLGQPLNPTLVRNTVTLASYSIISNIIYRLPLESTPPLN